MSEISTDEVTIDRIVEAMKHRGVTLENAESAPAAMANLNGRQVTFAALGSVAIVRAESLTETGTSAPDAAAWYMAANHLNSVQMKASAVIVDQADKLIVRTESEICAAAGLTDEQLEAALVSSVDGVLQVHDALGEVRNQFSGGE
ncbi:YbjN domain-containing protein [Corynebacterium yudongzhengii]|nr:YbjN domain-containing protein [Corynebacterium yudongzhengii]